MWGMIPDLEKGRGNADYEHFTTSKSSSLELWESIQQSIRILSENIDVILSESPEINQDVINLLNQIKSNINHGKSVWFSKDLISSYESLIDSIESKI